jgi:alkylhydroperoxidase/carboxymuconolactone decarboxylase family protein YurZ
MSATLSDKDVRLVRLFAAIVLGRWDDVRALRLAAPPGEPDREWREAVLQVHLFAGVPRQVEAYEVLDAAGGLGPLDPGESLSAPAWVPRGEPLFRAIYGPNAPAVHTRLAHFHPDFADWVLGHAYGRVLARPGLTPARRELLAVSALAATGQDRQLASHARGAVACGATPDEARATVECIADWIRAEGLERARAVLARFAR